MQQIAWLSVLFVAATACAPDPEPQDAADTPMSADVTQPGSSQPPMSDREWILTSVGDLNDPKGAQGKPVTIRFDSTAARAGGFAGCNQYSAAYTISGENVSFDAPIATRMFCEGFMDVETALLGVLERVTRYQVTDSTLTLYSADGPVAQFRAAPPS